MLLFGQRVNAHPFPCGAGMPTPDQQLTRPRRHFIDYLLYALVGAAFLSISYSFLLWLRY